jgi:hypothetical protein
MNRRRNKRGAQDTKAKEVVRCNYHQKPVFISDTCTDFTASHRSEGEKNCRNCQHSY